MPYDPAFPPSHGDLTSDAFRANFNGLSEKIEAVPAGPKGDRGVGIQSIQDTGGALLITTEDNTGWGPFPLPPGPAGAPGEVSAQQLSDAIAGTPRNVDGITPLYITISDPPTQSEVQQILDNYNGLVLALHRNV